MSKNPLKITFTLKQHTPIIHFQWEQDGAILRASELKPKLDKYLLGLKIQEIEEIDLDYKIKIITKGKTYVEPIQRQETFFNKYTQQNEAKFNKKGFPVFSIIPCFFGNMGKDGKTHKKELVYTNYDISIEFTIKNPVLREIIQDHFRRFIFHTNFGMRQSKGFGSFSVKDTVENEYGYTYFDIDLNDEIIKKYRPKILQLNTPDSYDIFKKTFPVFNAVNYLHKALRGGHNTVIKDETKFYFKSLMYRYIKIKFQDVNWDKKGIKQAFLSELDFNNQPNNDALERKKSELFRDLLGLSTQFEFRRNNRYSSYGFTVRHPKTSQDSLDRFHNELVQPNPAYRFKSPLIYKVVKITDDKYRIHLIPNSVDPWMLGKKFKLLKVVKKIIDNKEKSIIDNIMEISTPDQFDMVDFLKVSLNIGAFDDSVDQRYHWHNDYQLGKYIFSQFKREEN